MLQPICLACVITMSLLLIVYIGLGCCVGRPLDISLVLLLPWVYPVFYRQAPLVEGIFCWYGFLLGLALLCEPFGVGDCKG